MTEPGPIEQVPIKVVPMYIEPDPAGAVEPEPGSEPDEVAAPRAARPKTALVGGLAVAASVVAVLVDVAAVLIATNGTYTTATALSWLAIALSAVAVLAGLWAVVTNRGRRPGVAAIVLGLLSNPVLVLFGLRLIAGVQS